MREAFGRWLTESGAWCIGRHWPLRIVLLLWLTWVAGNHLADDAYASLFSGIDLGIHEGGHLLLRWCGQWLCTAGGTVAQCSAPVIAAVLLLRQGDRFSVPVCGVWLAGNLYQVALYCADASTMSLTLVTVGGGGGQREDCHDWHVLLSSVGMLGAESWLAPLIRLGAFALAWTSLALGAWMCWRMATGSSADRVIKGRAAGGQ
jgi:hypothetical protein